MPSWIRGLWGLQCGIVTFDVSIFPDIFMRYYVRVSKGITKGGSKFHLFL